MLNIVALCGLHVVNYLMLFHRSCLALLGTQWKFFRKLPPTFSGESRTAPEILLQVSDFEIIDIVVLLWFQTTENSFLTAVIWFLWCVIFVASSFTEMHWFAVMTISLCFLRLSLAWSSFASTSNWYDSSLISPV